MQLSRLDTKLREIADSFEGSVKVGFMAGATYPDGTPVPAVAYWNEFGTVTSPARPFFRRMIAKESPGWGVKLAGVYKATHDGEKALGMMGLVIEGELKQSINDLTSPPLAESTIARKGFSKPLIDTSHMINSITSVVES